MKPSLSGLVTIISLTCLLGLAGCSVTPNTSVEKQEEPAITPIDQRQYQSMLIDDIALNVEVVDTPERITLGLSYRTEIGSDGMLFAMPMRSIPSFWMLGMKFGLDMIWIDCGSDYQTNPQPDCVVVDTTKNIPPPKDPMDVSSLNHYRPIKDVTHILEVPYGWLESHSVDLGDIVEL